VSWFDGVPAIQNALQDFTDTMNRNKVDKIWFASLIICAYNQSIIIDVKVSLKMIEMTEYMLVRLLNLFLLVIRTRKEIHSY
jgi:hypothetical protein